MIGDVSVKIKDNNRKRVALDAQIDTLRDQLAKLNDEARALDAEQHRVIVAHGGGGDAAASGAMVSSKARR